MTIEYASHILFYSRETPTLADGMSGPVYICESGELLYMDQIVTPDYVLPIIIHESFNDLSDLQRCITIDFRLAGKRASYHTVSDTTFRVVKSLFLSVNALKIARAKTRLTITNWLHCHHILLLMKDMNYL